MQSDRQSQQTDPSDERIIAVLGATGNVGALVVDDLRRRARPVRPISRRAEPVASWRAEGLDGRRADLDHPDELTAVLDGVDTLLVIVPATPQQAERGRAAVESAAAAGVRRVVHVSSADARVGSPVPWADACARTDEVITASGLTWTILRPSAFDVDLFELTAPIGLGWLPQVAGDGEVGWIDVTDIARVAVEVLLEDGDAYDDRVLTLTGPELLSFGDVARVMSDRLGFRVRHVDLPVPVFDALLRLGGQDRWTRKAVIAQFGDVVRHRRDHVDVLTDTVAEVTGRAPVSVSSFVDAHRDRFAGPTPVRTLRGALSKTRMS